MAAYKLVTIIGIHPREQFFDGATADFDAAEAWEAALKHPAFVAAAAYKGGHVAPLSGQSFHLQQAQAVTVAGGN